MSMKCKFSIRPGMRLHFAGIGGIGMSGLARLCLKQGVSVSGCDVKLSSLSYQLQEGGISIAKGHDALHLDAGFDALIYSSAVSINEPELREARIRGLTVLSRGQLLAAFAAQRHLLAIAGAHGKTTTSGMTSMLLMNAGWDPSILVGGIMQGLNTNAHYGTGSYLVAETDESDGSFLHLSPQVAIVTNIDREHLNHYGSFEWLVEAFQRFVTQMAPCGTLIRCIDDPMIRSKLTYPSQLGYGLSPDADVRAEQISYQGMGSRFQVSYNGRRLGTFTLQVPGRHNVLNALATISLALVLDIPLIVARESLAAFQGTQRRFQIFRLPGDILFVEDYAHHPSEIAATLSAGQGMGRHRLVVFQPHRFSRTASLEDAFASCFKSADGVIVTDIYPAFEAPIPGISGERLAQRIKDEGHPCVRYVPNSEIPTYVSRIARPGDTFFFLGAGDIGEMCHDLAAQLCATQRALV